MAGLHSLKLHARWNEASLLAESHTFKKRLRRLFAVDLEPSTAKPEPKTLSIVLEMQLSESDSLSMDLSQKLHPVHLALVRDTGPQEPTLRVCRVNLRICSHVEWRTSRSSGSDEQQRFKHNCAFASFSMDQAVLLGDPRVTVVSIPAPNQATGSS